ncbi:hypothetical protein EPI10_001807 [Gossypium australe]|uniref:Uncharacterized protein n=1 Tax=Gossypium australe TaxID=47621 RepID=A0A5B6VCS2_9ROSI|nr:hypothetical protein EPI10_001807 [Gossypium australe]
MTTRLTLFEDRMILAELRSRPKIREAQRSDKKVQAKRVQFESTRFVYRKIPSLFRKFFMRHIMVVYMFIRAV